MALYLTYRPQRFADVVGQDHVVTTLERAVERNQLSHAYLLSGTRGTGKTSVARILAKTILLHGVTDEGVKNRLLKAIEDDTLVDLIEIDAASNRKIDDIRDLIEKIGFSPSVARAKVYIIDEVHMLTKEAFNALLKTLEEPPSYAYFILATTELHKVPDTIQSRCQRFLFRKVRDQDLIQRLQYIVDHEKINIDREALRAIARHAAGSFRDAIALLDQLQSLEKIGLQDVTERTGRGRSTLVDDIIGALNSRDVANILKTVEMIEGSNVPLDLVTSDLLGRMREELHVAIGEKRDLSSTIRTIDVLIEALKDLRLSPVPGLILETALLSLCADPITTEKRAISTTKGVLPLAASADAANKAATTIPDSAQVIKPKLIEAEPLTLESVQRHWEDVIRRTEPASARMSLKNGRLARIEGSSVHILFPSAFHRDKVAGAASSRNIEEILQSIFKVPVRIRCELDEEHDRQTAVGVSTDLVEAAAEVFGTSL